MSSERDQAVYRTKQWRNLRAGIFERDGYRCKIAGPKCTTVATQVDHIVPMSAGGAPYDSDNLRASCRACNVARSNQRSEAWRNASTKIMLVVGPPFAGKTKRVAELAAPGDLLVDYDTIAAGLGVERGDDSMHDVVAAARTAMLRKVQQGKSGVGTAWIVSANPDAESMFPWHEIVVVDPGVAVCVARCAGDEAARGRVVDWYRRRPERAVAIVSDLSSSRPW
jgi:hypothetical protein